ncbi:Uncharacterised protein [uncultured archaeon]|nr:Uncharacterised protein [uncultured archaeon]
MIKRVIFLFEYPFGQRDYDRFGIDTLQENGFEVEVWDFTPFLQPQVYKKVKIPDPINWEKCHSFLTWKEALSDISKLTPSTFIVCMIGYQFRSFAVYKALSKIKVPYCVLMANALPMINIKKDPVYYLDKLKRATLSKIFYAIFNRIPHNCIGIRPACIVLAGGTKSTNYKYPISDKTEILWLHTLDYDIYLNECNKPAQNDMNQGIFLDQYLPFHPDYIHSGLSPPSTPEEYYPKIRKFFDLIERETGASIIIAAHPRSDYEIHPDYFGGRIIIKGKTVELIKNSRFIICHSSTAINYAVLFHKPIIFITSNIFQQNWFGPTIELMASQLGKKPINIDNLIESNWDRELSIDEEAYMKYKHSYIKKTGSEELPFWQIFANRIKKID